MKNPLDWLSEKTGIVLVEDRLKHPVAPGVVTIKLPGYRQTNTFACGLAAATMVVHHFYPRRSINRLYELVGPEPSMGTPTTRLVRALRQSGVAVEERDDLKWVDIRSAISEGRPIIVTVNTRSADVRHWCVLYGAATAPNRVYLAGYGIPWLGRKEYSYAEFRTAIWNEVGEGLICRRARRARSPS